MSFYRLPDKEKLLIYNKVRESVPLPLPTIEKDWWVVQTLALVYQLEAAPHLVFKGGTSLSKAWGIIERFSEDIDLVLSREFLGFTGKISRTQVGKLRDASYRYISESLLPELRKAFRQKGLDKVEIDLWDVKTPDQDPVNIVIRYPSVTQVADYIEPVVKLEIGSRSMLEPHTRKGICSFVGEVFKGQSFADDPISVPCVNPERTYLEKLFLLHEEFQRPEAEIRVDRMSRHLYDIQRISSTEYAQTAMKNKELYHSLVWHREHFMRWGGIDYHTHFPPTLNPVPPTHLRSAFESDYKTMQEQMIYGDTLPFDQLIREITEIASTINKHII